MKSVLIVRQLTPSRLVAVRGNPGSKGDPGIQGDPGRNIELQAGVSHIQWRYAGDTTWLDLIARAELKGDPGASIELQVGATHIQWRVVGAALWTDLIALTALKGADGIGVPVGGATGQVLAKTSNADGATGWIDPPAGGGGGGASQRAIAYTPGVLLDLNGLSYMSMSSFTMTVDRIQLQPIMFSRDITFSELSIVVGTAATGAASVGIYNNAVVGGADLPGDLLVALNNTISTSPTGLRSGALGAPVTLTAGVLYWLAVSTTAAAALRAHAGYQDVSLGLLIGGTTVYRLAKYYANVAGSGSQLPATLLGQTFVTNDSGAMPLVNAKMA